MEMNSFENILGQLFKQALIEHLEQKGLIFDEEITANNHKNHKFTAWKMLDFKWSNIEGAVKQIFKTIDSFIEEEYSNNNQQIHFNLKNCECLKDRDCFDYLFRTLVYFKPEDNK